VESSLSPSLPPPPPIPHSAPQEGCPAPLRASGTRLHPTISQWWEQKDGVGGCGGVTGGGGWGEVGRCSPQPHTPGPATSLAASPCSRLHGNVCVGGGVSNDATRVEDAGAGRPWGGTCGGRVPQNRRSGRQPHQLPVCHRTNTTNTQAHTPSPGPPPPLNSPHPRPPGPPASKKIYH
jgi:hypothetical protein